MGIDIEIFQEHARKNLFMIQQDNYYRNLHQFQELRETTNSKEIPDRISNDSPFLLIDRDI
jgi:hypothetical protein